MSALADNGPRASKKRRRVWDRFIYHGGQERYFEAMVLRQSQTRSLMTKATQCRDFPRWRTLVIGWFDDFAEDYVLDPDTMGLTISLMDRYCDARVVHKKSTSNVLPEGAKGWSDWKFGFHCICCACMSIAEKFLTESDMVDVLSDATDDSYSPREICMAEYEVLGAVEWRVYCVLPHHYTRFFYPNNTDLLCDAAMKMRLHDDDTISVAVAIVELTAENENVRIFSPILDRMKDLANQQTVFSVKKEIAPQ